jgi:hypothetical protein
MAHPVGPRLNITQEVYAIAFNAGVGAYAAHLFSLVHPAGGAIFGVVRTLTSAVVERVLDRVIDETPQGKTLKRALKFFAGVAAAWGAMTLAGFSITFGAAVTLAIATIPAEFIIRCFLPAPQVNRPVARVQEQQQQPARPHLRVRVNEDNPEGQVEGQPDLRPEAVLRVANERERAFFQGEGRRLGEV